MKVQDDSRLKVREGSSSPREPKQNEKRTTKTQHNRSDNDNDNDTTMGSERKNRESPNTHLAHSGYSGFGSLHATFGVHIGAILHTSHVSLQRKGVSEKSHHVTSRHVTSHHVTSRHITSRHLTSRHVTSRHVTSRHVTSRHVTSHQRGHTFSV